MPAQIHLNPSFIRKMYLDENLTKKELVELCHCTVSQLNDILSKTDPLKRRIAKQDKLNWIEFFNVQEFIQWISAKGNVNGTITC